MEHKSLVSIIRKQNFPKLIYPLLILIVAIVFLIIKPFKNALKTTDVTDLSCIESMYDNGTEYIKYSAGKLYYTGLDYTIGNKSKANIYYSTVGGTCYYFIIASKNSNGLATTLENYTVEARLIKNDKTLDEINSFLADNINFSEKGMAAVSCPLIISQYDYSKDFTRFVNIAILVICAVSAIAFIIELLSVLSPTLSPSILTLGRYGNRKTLFALAVSELDTAVATGRKNVFITDNFLIIVTRTDVDIIPLENIVWVYDFDEVHYKKGKTKMFHPLHIVTDIKKVYKIHHVTETGVAAITNALLDKHPEIMVGYENK